MRRPGSTPNLLAITTISAAALSYEIVLSRLFSVQQFYHFAFVVISLAVLGFAASGTLLSLRPSPPDLGLLSFLFSLSIGLVYLILNWLPFDSFSIAWDRSQLWILLLYFLTASLPFVFSGWLVGGALTAAGPSLHLPYAANLIGSALGCGIALVGMNLFGGEGAVYASMSLGFLTCLLLTRQKSLRVFIAALLGLGIWMSLSPPSSLALKLSPYKPLSMTSLIPNARLRYSEWSETTRVDIVESQGIHIFPGLSLNMIEQLPDQLALFIDGDGPLPITRQAVESAAAARIAEGMPGSLAYQLRPAGEVLILRGGTGAEALHALSSGAQKVYIAMPDRLVLQALQEPQIAGFQEILHDPRVFILERSDRGALNAGDSPYDLIVFALSEPFRPVSSGAFSLTETYSLTVEALQDGIERLSPQGLLVVTQWLGTPPAESAKAWATLLKAWSSTGKNPADHLIAYRSMRTATLIASNQPFGEQELQTTRIFLKQNGFDPIHLPDLKLVEVNRFNKLPSPVYHDLFRQLMNDPAQVIRNYNLRIEPPTDDRPYFFHFFRWAQTPAILNQLGYQWLPFGGSGYLVLLALLILIGTVGGLLMIFPLLGRKEAGLKATLLSWEMLYFAAVGAGYLLVEISLLQRFMLLFDRPAFALAAVLFGLLLASGLGSLAVPKIHLHMALAGLCGYLLFLAFSLHPLLGLALAWDWFPKVILTILLIAPAGFLMGVPFAHGLTKLQATGGQSIPWAWAVNGAVSGISGVLAVMISLDLGIRATLLVGTGAYLLSLLASVNPRWKTVPSPPVHTQ